MKRNCSTGLGHPVSRQGIPLVVLALVSRTLPRWQKLRWVEGQTKPENLRSASAKTAVLNRLGAEMSQHRVGRANTTTTISQSLLGLAFLYNIHFKTYYHILSKCTNIRTYTSYTRTKCTNFQNTYTNSVRIRDFIQKHVR